MSELFLRALLASAGVGLLAGMLGCFVIWRRMAYMGDAMGHAALLGVVIGLIAGIAPSFAVAAVAVVIGFGLSLLQRDKRLPFDALLGVVSTGGLALGLVLYSLYPTRQVDLYGYLFGDILAVSEGQLLLLYGAVIVQGLALMCCWRALLRMILHPDIAQVEGVPVTALQALMTVLVAVTVALALQIVGMLLITALLVIPPLAARVLSRSPLQMVLCSMGAGVLSALGGVQLSFHHDLPAGASIVLAAIIIFLLALIVSRLFKRQH